MRGAGTPTSVSTFPLLDSPPNPSQCDQRWQRKSWGQKLRGGGGKGLGKLLGRGGVDHVRKRRGQLDRERTPLQIQVALLGVEMGHP